MPDLVYRPPAPEETDAVLAFLSRGIAGAEAYTFLRLNREYPEFFALLTRLAAEA